MYCRVTHTALSKFIEGGAIWVRSDMSKEPCCPAEDHSGLSNAECYLQIHWHCGAAFVSSCLPPRNTFWSSLLCIRALHCVLFWAWHHALPSLPYGAAGLLFSSTSKRVESSVTHVNTVAVPPAGTVSRLSRFWFSFSLPGNSSALCVSRSPHKSLL